MFLVRHIYGGQAGHLRNMSTDRDKEGIHEPTTQIGSVFLALFRIVSHLIFQGKGNNNLQYEINKKFILSPQLMVI